VRLCFFFFFLRFCTLSHLPQMLSTCSKNHIYSVPFFKLLTVHQQLAARMKNQSRGVFMFNNLDRAENLAFHFIWSFCVSVRVSFYFAFVNYLSLRKVTQRPLFGQTACYCFHKLTNPQTHILTDRATTLPLFVHTRAQDKSFDTQLWHSTVDLTGQSTYM